MLHITTWLTLLGLEACQDFRNSLLHNSRFLRRIRQLTPCPPEEKYKTPYKGWRSDGSQCDRWQETINVVSVRA